MSTFEKTNSQIKEDAFNKAKKFLEANGIPVCFGNIAIPNYRPFLGINEFTSENRKKDMEQEYISTVENTAKQVIQCANCGLYEKCFKLSLLGYLNNISFDIYNFKA